MGVKGYIMNIQPFSVNDGEGIRTNIFIAGCPLRCAWCSNPEGFEQRPLVGWYSRRCIGCGACVSVCPNGVAVDMDDPVCGRGLCTACGACVSVCPEEARSHFVRLMDADDIIKEVQKHRIFYAFSGGGATFSGGEATSQPELLDYLSKELYDMGCSLDLESCGYFDFETLRPSLERMDLIFMDLKHMDPEIHKKYTGVSNERILKNIRLLGTLNQGGESMKGEYGAARPSGGKGPEIVIRIPVIGGVNDSEENIAASAAYVHDTLPCARMELLPYHRLGKIKYEAIGRPFGQDDFYTPSKEKMQKLRDTAASQGVLIADYR